MSFFSTQNSPPPWQSHPLLFWLLLAIGRKRARGNLSQFLRCRKGKGETHLSLFSLLSFLQVAKCPFIPQGKLHCLLPTFATSTVVHTV